MKESEKELGKKICHVSLLFRRKFDNLVATESAGYTDSLSGRNIWVLRYLEKHRGEDVFQKDLETAFKIRRSTVSHTVELMEQKGLLRRESVNGDARLKRLCLTSKAEEILSAVSRGVDRMEEQVREAFLPQDYEKLLQLLDQLGDALDAPEDGIEADLENQGKE